MFQNFIINQEDTFLKLRFAKKLYLRLGDPTAPLNKMILAVMFIQKVDKTIAKETIEYNISERAQQRVDREIRITNPNQL